MATCRQPSGAIKRPNPGPEIRLDQLARKLVSGMPAGSAVRGHSGGNRGGNLRSIAHRCHLIRVASVWALTKETIDMPLGCLQGGLSFTSSDLVRSGLGFRVQGFRFRADLGRHIRRVL